MLFYELEINGKIYKLRLATRAVVALERQIGCSPLGIFGKGDTIPTTTTMVYVLHAALQQYQHGITLNDAYDIFDEYLADGNTAIDFISVIVEVYKASGIIKDENEKN